jgi:hypothetical protein
MSRVRNAAVQVRWIGALDQFWFRDETATGPRFVRVDAATGERRPLFDHAKVAQALSADPAALPFTDLDLADDGLSMQVMLPGGPQRVDLENFVATTLPPHAPAEMALPDGRVLIARQHDLWLRGADGAERRLTDDGEPAHAWAVMGEMDLMSVARSRGLAGKPLVGCFPSPDLTRVLALRIDEREVEPYP